MHIITHKKISIIAVFAVLAVGAASFEWYYADKFYPNTFIGEVRVSGMTYGEAAELLLPYAARAREDGMRLQFVKDGEMRTVHIPSSASGLTSDTVVEYFSVGDSERALRAAYERGREFPLLFRFASKITSPFRVKRFDPGYAVYPDAIISLLERELEEFVYVPRDAAFREVRGTITLIPEMSGVGVDYEEVVDTLYASLTSAGPPDRAFEAVSIEPDLIEEALAPYAEFMDAFARSVTLEMTSGPFWWRARGPLLAEWVALDGDAETRFEVRIEKVREFANRSIVPFLDGPMVNSRFEMKNGTLTEIVPGKAGLDVNLAVLAHEFAHELEAIYKEYLATGGVTKKSVVIEVAIEEVEPRVTNETVNQYGITGLVGRAVTSFAGSSADRAHNIKIGASKINGLVLAPGEEFSAVKTIGRVNAEEGYRQEFVIKGNQSVKEYGGGLCQIATTLFRLGLDGGLPITERKNHSYVVGYYGPGLDATIYGPWIDLKFVNDTGNYVLLQAWTEGTDLIMELYGTRDGRAVTISEPRFYDFVSPPDTRLVFTSELPLGARRCTERRRDGLTSEADYIVEYADGTMRTQTFVSTYVPWQEVCLVGTGV